MTVDREQIRGKRPLEFESYLDIGLRKLRDYGGGAVLSDAEANAVLDRYDAVLAELEQAERERDEARKSALAFEKWAEEETVARDAAEAQLAKVSGLVDKINLGRHSFEMLRHHEGNDKATIAWARTVVRECAAIFADPLAAWENTCR